MRIAHVTFLEIWKREDRTRWGRLNATGPGDRDFFNEGIDDGTGAALIDELSIGEEP